MLKKSGPHGNLPKLDHTLLFGCTNLFEEIGKKIMIVQKDGKNLIGTLGSVDHFGNLFLYGASERICVGSRSGHYGDIHVGAVLVRGDSLALTCEIDNELEQKIPMKQVTTDEILKLRQEESRHQAENEERIMKGLKVRGITYSARETGFNDE